MVILIKNMKKYHSSFLFVVFALFALFVETPISSDTDELLFYVLLPSVSAFIAAFLLSSKICYKHNIIFGNLIQSLMISIFIVILSISIWVIMLFILSLFSYGRPASFFVPMLFGFVAATEYAHYTFPPGLLAGFIIWHISKKHNKQLNSDGVKNTPPVN